MKILVASDFHGNSKAFQKIGSKAKEINADVIAVCGDITQFGTLQQVKNFLSILASVKLPLYYVLGNTDPLLSAEEVKIEGATYLHAAYKIHGDTMFLGVGNTTTRQFYTPEEDIQRILNHIFNSCPKEGRRTVLISHFPPRDTKLDLAYIGGHVGSLSLRKFIEEKKPAAVFCGHIHESRGIERIGDTIMANPGPASHGYYAIANLNRKIEVELCEGA
ncbi:MAG: metallophosphoesterase family protein [Candidatus Bathyarchaeia archaeon]